MATPEQQWSSGERRPWDGPDEEPAALPSGSDNGSEGRFLTRRERRLAEQAAGPSTVPSDDFSLDAPPRSVEPPAASPGNGGPSGGLLNGAPPNRGSKNGPSLAAGSSNGASSNGASSNGASWHRRSTVAEPVDAAPAPLPVLQPRRSTIPAPLPPAVSIGRTPLPDSVRRPPSSPFDPSPFADPARIAVPAPVPQTAQAVPTPPPAPSGSIRPPAAAAPSGSGWSGEVADLAAAAPPGRMDEAAPSGWLVGRGAAASDTTDAAATEAIPVASAAPSLQGLFGASSVDGIRDSPVAAGPGSTSSAAGAWPTGGPGTAGKTAGPKGPPPSMGRRLMRDAREVLGTVAVALGIAIVIKTFLVQPFKIPSQSMQDTLLVGDRVLVSKLEPGPLSLQRGDVVVFLDPGGWLDGVDSPEQQSVLNQALTFIGLLPANSGEHLIKRVIGLPGDTVKCCDADGRLLINNQPIDETSYIYPGDQPSADEFQVTVPDGTLWVMGDHRSVSRDSRFHAVDGDLSAGAVPLDHVVGRAVLVSWPLSRWDWLGRPEGVFHGVGQLDGVK